MNYTEKYHLPQWEETDRIMRVDFNQMCADLEDGINDAKVTAEDAKSEALKLPYVVGSYKGKGGKNRHFDIGFRPSFVIVAAFVEQVSSGDTGADHYFIASCGTTAPHQLVITDDGFTVNTGNYSYPNLDSSGMVYNYIAFR